MKNITVQFILAICTLTLAFSLSYPVFAHGGEPRLEISTDFLSPGGILDVRGVDFEPEELVTLSLTGPSGEITLGEVTADVEGIFLHTLILPTDLMEGAYSFHAVTDDHVVISPSLTVSGPPILEGEPEGQRDEDDALLAPMPTYSPVIVQSADVPSETASTDSNSQPLLIPLTALAVIGIMAVAGMWRMRKH